MIKGLLLDVEGTIVGDKRYQPVGRGVEFVAEARPPRIISSRSAAKLRSA